ncbi:ribonuclease domain-containing protein [Streptomyces sp. NRRL B-1347]|uniref:ribonuclease domain-containing protein n=1 Tax=Streptomyces sp. NRRL B-1347 TaxID=1476877 RepID=UPI0004C6357F|nr:ribonuclease domain-containing protein [Streptomyces sp. NRRL B-1347]
MIIRSAGRVLCALLVCLAALVTGCGTERDSGTARDGGTASRPASTPAWARGMATVTADRLPAEARRTLRLIDEGGPFPYPKDGTVFGNFEGRLPREPRGYYREYTVRTPGERGRGARRLVTGREHETYYTDDHYASFKAVLR